MITHTTGCLAVFFKRLESKLRNQQTQQEKKSAIYDNYETESQKFDLMCWRNCKTCKVFVLDNFDDLKRHLTSYRHTQNLKGGCNQ